MARDAKSLPGGRAGQGGRGELHTLPEELLAWICCPCIFITRPLLSPLTWRRRIITQAGMGGTLNSTAQFPLEASPAGIAAAGAAALSRPEVAALALPHEAAAQSALVASAVDGTAAAPESAAASAPAAEVVPASDAAAAQDAEAAAFVTAQEAAEAPLAAQPGAANGSSLAGEDCSATLDLLNSHPSYSIFRSLLATAGKQARGLSEVACAFPWSAIAEGAACRPPNIPLFFPTWAVQVWRAPSPRQTPSSSLRPATGEVSGTLCTMAMLIGGNEHQLLHLRPATITQSKSPAHPRSAWMLAVGQYPLLRYDAEALRTTLLQHIIVGPQDFSSSALVSCGFNFRLAGPGMVHTLALLERLEQPRKRLPLQWRLAMFNWPPPAPHLTAALRRPVRPASVHQEGSDQQLDFADRQPGVGRQHGAGGSAHLCQPALPGQQRAAAAHLTSHFDYFLTAHA